MQAAPHQRSLLPRITCPAPSTLTRAPSAHVLLYLGAHFAGGSRLRCEQVEIRERRAVGSSCIVAHGRSALHTCPRVEPGHPTHMPHLAFITQARALHWELRGSACVHAPCRLTCCTPTSHTGRHARVRCAPVIASGSARSIVAGSPAGRSELHWPLCSSEKPCTRGRMAACAPLRTTCHTVQAHKRQPASAARKCRLIRPTWAGVS